MKEILLFCSLLWLKAGAKNEVSVIKALSTSLGKMVIDCQKELEFKNEVIHDLLDFWNDQNNLKSEDLGCAMVCVFEKHEFLSADGTTVQQAKVRAYARKLGADDALAKHLVELLVLCKKGTSSIKSFCDSTLEMVKCYRYGIFRMKWNPDRFYWRQSKSPSNSKVKAGGR